MKDLKVVSLFSGCGGLDWGWHELGASVVFANDFNKTACESYRFNYEKFRGMDCNHLHEGDINKLWKKIPNGIDVLLAGAPCQSWSLMGARKGFKDDRGDLFLKTIEIVNEKRPTFFIFENVAGLLSHDNGESLNSILKLIDSIGYDVTYRLLDFTEYGVHQGRKRVIFWGKLKENYTDLKSLIPKKMDFTPFSSGQLLNLLNLSSLTFLNSEKTQGRAADWARLILPGDNIAHVDLEDLKSRYLIINKSKMPIEIEEKRPRGIRPVYRLDPNKVAPTMVFNDGTNIPWHPWEDRIITVREAATIQAFPLGFEFKGKLRDQYRQIANAVPPTFSIQLAKQFIENFC